MSYELIKQICQSAEWICHLLNEFGVLFSGWVRTFTNHWPCYCISNGILSICLPEEGHVPAQPTLHNKLWSKSGHMDCQKQKEQTNKQIIVRTLSLLIQACTKICISATRPFRPMYSTLTKKLDVL